jgi:hypothetical protein
MCEIGREKQLALREIVEGKFLEVALEYQEEDCS